MKTTAFEPKAAASARDALTLLARLLPSLITI
jgi:hypothetical protein